MYLFSYRSVSKRGYFWSEEGFRHLLCDIPGTSQRKAAVLAQEYRAS